MCTDMYAACLLLLHSSFFFVVLVCGQISGNTVYLQGSLSDIFRCMENAMFGWLCVAVLA